jgi:hypothetical protein
MTAWITGLILTVGEVPPASTVSSPACRRLPIAFHVR